MPTPDISVTTTSTLLKVMETESVSPAKMGLFAQGSGWLKALPKKFKDFAVKIVYKTKKLGQDDPRRVTHSLKSGLALTLVSIFYYLRPIYNAYGDSAMFAVLTVVLVFEFSVGATLGKCLNRGFATLLAGAIGVGAQKLASLAGTEGEPIVLSALIFVIVAAATFSRFFPRIKARYDYGLLVFILTFSLVAISGYHEENILELAHEKLSTVAIGCLICVVVSVAIYPVWAGEDLHKLVALNIEKLADFLEGFEVEYFVKLGDGESSTTSKKGYKTVLNSKTTEETLASFSRWEPFHGKFMFRLPWKQYLKVGVLTRQCAYHVESLNSYINSDIPVPEDFKERIQEACTKMSSESGKALRGIAIAIRTMTEVSASNIHVVDSKAASNNLKTILRSALPTNIDLTHIIPAVTVASLLTEVVACTEEIVDSVHELARLSKFKMLKPSTILTLENSQSRIFHRATIVPVCNIDDAHAVITVCEPSIPLPEKLNSQELNKSHSVQELEVPEMTYFRFDK